MELEAALASREAAVTAAEWAATAKAAKLEEAWTCAVCLGLYFEPTTLPCGHSLCACCWERVSARGAGGALCPMCRAPAPGAMLVNAGLMHSMELNAGRGFLKQRPTLNLHRALRAGDAAGACAAIKQGCDLERPVRSAATGAAAETPLHFVLGALGKEDAAEAWVQVATDHARTGVGVKEKSAAGVLPLDRSTNVHISRLMLENGANKCTPVAFKNVAGWHYVTAAGKSQDIDATLFKLLACINIRETRASDPNIASGCVLYARRA